MKSQFVKLFSVSALIELSGYVLSGPTTFFPVDLINSPPPWVSSSVFINSYNGYFTWNVLMMLTMISIYRDSKNSKQYA